MINPVKKCIQITIHYPSVARPDGGLCLTNGLMRTAIGAKPVAAVMEVFLPARLQHLCNRLLNKPILYRRYTQLAGAAIWLGDLDAAYRFGTVCPVL